MTYQTITIKRVLPLSIVLEVSALFLVISVILWFVPVWSEHVLAGTPSFDLVLSRAWSGNEGKQVRLSLYGNEYSVNTFAENMDQFAELYPFLYKFGDKELFQKLAFIDGGTVSLPLNQYEIGTASWYGSYFQGRPTASTEPYNMHALTAAHKELPLGTVVRVTNLENKKQVVVRINDRGPYVGERVIDMSYAGARQLGYVGKGVTNVLIEILKEDITNITNKP